LKLGRKKIVAKNQLSQELTDMRNQLSTTLKSKVMLTCNAKGNGKISIAFNNEDDLRRIMQLLNQSNADN